MRPKHLLSAALLFLATLGATACDGASPETATSTGTTSSGTGGTGGAGSSSSGGEPLPPLDPSLCPVTADSGEDPALADAAETAWSPDYDAPASDSLQQDKAFFFATLLQADAALFADLLLDPTLAAASADRDDRLRAAPADCAEDVACYKAALGWTDSDAASVAGAIRARLEASGTLATFAADMRASGRFGLHALKDDATLLETAYLDLTVALGETLSQEASSLGGAGLRAVVEATSAAHPEPLTFVEPLLLVDLGAMIADMRDEATRYEPLVTGENAKAAAHIPTIDWAEFPFTVILVPGKGPNELDIPLDPAGRERADLAAQRFEAKIAPLIALSGGHVHPDRTPYSEAIEMKKYLMEEHGIPEEALLVDPHARHTTTNLRNVTRLLYRYGVPSDRPVLVTTDVGQSIYIAFWHGTFGPRCIEELGYLPWRSLVSLSKYDACMMPVAVSLHADGRDPLDP